MKKGIFLLVLLFCFIFSLFAGETDDYKGTYLPVDYIELLQKYKNHEKALKEIVKTHYSVLYLFETKCFHAYCFDVSSPVEEENFKKWKYTTKKNEKYITDENGYIYRRISPILSNDIPCEFIAHNIFESFPAAPVKIGENTITIDNTTYQFNLSPNYPRENIMDCALHLYILDKKTIGSDCQDFFVLVENDGFMIIRGQNVNDRWVKPLPDEIVYVYKNT